MGFLKKIAKVGLAPATGGLSLLGKDKLLGKEQDPFDPYRMIDADPDLKKTVEAGRVAQRTGLAELMKTATPEAVKAEMARESKLATVSAEDQRRQAEQQIAQRGLGRSSIGMGIQKGISQALADRKAGIAASMPERMRQRQQEIIGAGSRLTGQQDYRTMLTGTRKGRSGGILGALAPIAGGVIGAKMGGVKGAGQGMQMGQGLASAFSNFG